MCTWKKFEGKIEAFPALVKVKGRGIRYFEKKSDMAFEEAWSWSFEVARYIIIPKLPKDCE